MSTAEQGTTAAEDAVTATVDMRLEVVVLPVSDVDRAKAFYASLGWRLDADLATGEDFRVVQLTPPGSTASVIFGTGLTTAAAGSADSLVLVVPSKRLVVARAGHAWQRDWRADYRVLAPFFQAVVAAVR